MIKYTSSSAAIPAAFTWTTGTRIVTIVPVMAHNVGSPYIADTSTHNQVNNKVLKRIPEERPHVLHGKSQVGSHRQAVTAYSLEKQTAEEPRLKIVPEGDGAPGGSPRQRRSCPNGYQVNTPVNNR